MSIKIDKVDFVWNQQCVLKQVNFQLKPGSRCLLVGSNGVGKTSLLRLLAGKHLIDNVMVLDKHTFHDTTLNFQRTYLDENWGLRTLPFAGQHVPYMTDIKVGDMMTHLQQEFPERREQLIELLGIDPQWRMHQVSSGQRRRVQLFLGLLRPVRVILLDEISNVLDIVCREKVFQWLLQDSIQRQTTIVYATHIFDGLEKWFTHILYLKPHHNQNSMGFFGPRQYLTLPLYPQVKSWLLEEKKQIETTQPPPVSRSAGGFADGRFLSSV